MAGSAEVVLTLDEDLQRFIAEEAGRQGLASEEFIARLLRERLRRSRLAALDDALARGLEDAEKGRVIPLDEAFDRLRAELNL
jgi:antitoxin ParD1/3/4